MCCIFALGKIRIVEAVNVVVGDERAVHYQVRVEGFGKVRPFTAVFEKSFPLFSDPLFFPGTHKFAVVHLRHAFLEI